VNQLTGVDASFLYIESPTQPLHVCSILELDTSTVPGGYSFDRLRDELAVRITAIPELLRLVDISGAIITIDAMGTQKAIAAQIVGQGADYVLALKGNQETLHDAVIEYIDKQSENDFADCEVRRHTTTETSHGRHEIRSYVHMPVPGDLAGLDLWKGLASMIRLRDRAVRSP